MMNTPLRSIVFGLRRVFLLGDFISTHHGEVDKFTEKIIKICERCPSEEKIYQRYPFMSRKNQKLVKDDPLSLYNVCSQYEARFQRRGLRREELFVVRKYLSIPDTPFIFYKPMYLDTRIYRFGLVSHRIWACVLLKESFDLEKLAIAWKSLAHAFKEIIQENMRSEGVSRFSLASKYFSEVSIPFDTDLSYIDLVMSKRSPLEILGIEDSLLKHLLSPLKLREKLPEYIRVDIPQPAYISRDGVVILFPYSLKDGLLRGSRRGAHSTRRKIRRRSLGLAADLALGLKVFLDNPDMWLSNVEKRWGLLTGIIYLNPRVVETITGMLDDRAKEMYRGIIDVLGLMKPFDGFLSGLFYPLEKDEEINRLNAILVCLKGGEVCIERVPPLNNTKLEIIKFVIKKDYLDRNLGPLDEKHVELISCILCSFGPHLLNNLRLIVEGKENVLDNFFSTKCSKKLKECITSRWRGEAGRRGLAARELGILLKTTGIHASIEKDDTLDSLVNDGFLKKSFSEKKDSKGPSSVSVYLPDFKNKFVIFVYNCLVGALKETLDLLEAIKDKYSLLSSVFG